jgi:hypothetical protein
MYYLYYSVIILNDFIVQILASYFYEVLCDKYILGINNVYLNLNLKIFSLIKVVILRSYFHIFDFGIFYTDF